MDNLKLVLVILAFVNLKCVSNLKPDYYGNA
jgi:hypothetical protein